MLMYLSQLMCDVQVDLKHLTFIVMDLCVNVIYNVLDSAYCNPCCHVNKVLYLNWILYVNGFTCR